MLVQCAKRLMCPEEQRRAQWQWSVQLRCRRLRATACTGFGAIAQSHSAPYIVCGQGSSRPGVGWLGDQHVVAEADAEIGEDRLATEVAQDDHGG